MEDHVLSKENYPTLKKAISKLKKKITINVILFIVFIVLMFVIPVRNDPLLVKILCECLLAGYTITVIIKTVLYAKALHYAYFSIKIFEMTDQEENKQ